MHTRAAQAQKHTRADFAFCPHGVCTAVAAGPHDPECEGCSLSGALPAPPRTAAALLSPGVRGRPLAREEGTLSI